MARQGEWRVPYRLSRRRLQSDFFRNFMQPSTYSCTLWRHRRGHFHMNIHGRRVKIEAVAFVNFGTTHELPVRKLFTQ